jgi:hypothetical protein
MLCSVSLAIQDDEFESFKMMNADIMDFIHQLTSRLGYATCNLSHDDS